MEGGNEDVVDLMIEKGANDFRQGLWIACENAHVDLVKLMFLKKVPASDKALNRACKGEFFTNIFKAD